ncbi:type III-A CRISPR-associated protein Cas10/Csm1 [Desulfotruncus alcoholivorax]|uniref:type III-A CRISPR-associated protein Cas10/Csm1 n=1 Tax=Desulfotruncus alcoholivorax TaxID=265477 RepID=UPI00040B0778|nr:type III-A CRISPR-associated protein Cas10/Csm1 [Desulfotruncus alcoholivorax]
MEKEYQTVVLAGLLHDIGKFLHRGEFTGSLKVAGKYPAVSASFIKARREVFEKVADVDLLIELVQCHHKSNNFPPELRVQQADPTIRPLAYLVSTADNYSSAERGEESDSYRDYKTVPLDSVFARLKLTCPTPEAQKYKLHLLNPANAFPQSLQKLDVEQTNNYLNAFGREFDSMVQSINLADFDCLYAHLLSILQRYTWCVPANTQEMNPDISLFDHLRTTSAIAACLYHYHKNPGNLNPRDVADGRADKFRLVIGDLSGIQNYIFDIANIGVGGVAKRLRARSFYLSALSEAISHRLIHAFNLPIANIVMSSGGKFYVLLPNLPGSEERIKEFQNELDRWSVVEFGGEIIINLGQVAFSGCAFHSFGEILSELAEKLNNRKNAPLKGYLVEKGDWSKSRFKVDNRSLHTGICRSCNKREATLSGDGDALCWQCRRDMRMGTLLPAASYVGFAKGKVTAQYSNATFPLYGDYNLTLFINPPDDRYPGYLIYKLNETNLTELVSHPALSKFMANYIPLAAEENCHGCPGCADEIKPAPGSPVYFDCLANRARGRKLLGYLKADVDNLGSLFVYGLRDDIVDRNSISRIATMSRMLELFFSGRVEQLLNIKFNSCYTVYSGGDDLLIVGPWDEIKELALAVQDEFKKFTNDNDNITLSAGIGLIKPDIPVSKSLQVAGEALEESKETMLKGETEGRNQLTFLGRTMKWPRARPILEMADQLTEWLENGEVSTGFLRKLLVFFAMYQQFYIRGDVRGLKYLPLLNYTIARTFPLPDQYEPEKLAVRLWAEKLKLFDHDYTVYLDFLIKYAFLAKE